MSSNRGDATPDLAGVSPEDFAAMVAGASDEQLAEVMNGPQREPALREIFNRMADHMDAVKARGHDAVVHFLIPGRPDGGEDGYQLVIDDGKAEVSETLDRDPRVKLRVEAVSFLRLITNQKSGPELFMSGQLKLEGDLMFAPQIASLFRMPTAPKEESN